nr:MAG TPA: hypothetical protein [Caudoviricetes sp.]
MAVKYRVSDGIVSNCAKVRTKKPGVGPSAGISFKHKYVGECTKCTKMHTKSL